MDRTAVDLLIEAACIAPSADNTQPEHLTLSDDQLIVSYDEKRVGNLTFGPESHATRLSLGMSCGNMERICELVGINVQFEVDLSNADRLITVSGLAETNVDMSRISSARQDPLFERHTNRLPFEKRKLDQGVLDELQQFNSETCEVLSFSEGLNVATVARLVTDASKIRFQTQEVHEWLGKSLRFGEEAVKQADGLDVRTLHLPPGGSSLLKLISNWKVMKALNIVGIYKALSAIDTGPVKAAPLLLALKGADTPEAVFESGKTLGRLWAWLNQKGIAVHPYYVIADQLNRLKEGTVPQTLVAQAEQLKLNATAQFQLSEGETLHMLLRVGYPKKQPVRSLRLPLDKVLTDLTSGPAEQ